ncbi:unnamed protein product [Amaranthus hypochondriacus]
MASGSSSRPNSGSKGFDFASDDILCSYEDYTNQDSSNGVHSDPSIGINSAKDFQKSRISRSSVFPAANAYSQPEDSLSQEMISTVERTMKKYSDNLMRFLEGISSRLSQLELYCYNLDKSIGEMRSDLARDHGESDSKLKFLEKHVQEVHRSVQILRDKQELAETQKELAKLQLAQKDSSSPGQDEKNKVPTPEQKNDDVSDAPNTQLALALPSQISQQPSHAAAQQQSIPPPQPPPSQTHSQMQPYYLPSNQLPNPQAQSHPSYLSTDAQYREPQLQAPQPSQTQVNQTSQTQQFPQYQQQWPQQVTQSMQPPAQPPQQPQIQPSMQPQTQIRTPSPQSSVYPLYMTSQPMNPPPQDGISGSTPMQMPFPGIPHPGMGHPEGMPYGYGGAGRPVQPQPSPHMKGGFPSQPGDGYKTASAGPYMLYDGDGGRSHQPPQPTHYSQGVYPPPNPSVQNQPPPPPNSSNRMIRSPSPQQYVRSHPYNELIDKLVSMGYRGDHVASVIQRLEESGQAVDFNAVLDRLNGHSSGSSQQSW